MRAFNPQQQDVNVIARMIDETGQPVSTSYARPTSNARLASAAASTNATVVKVGPGAVFHVSGYNANAAARYLKIYNKATAPTVGTDVPIHTEYLAPQAKFSISFPAGLAFATGIGFGLTTGGADNDTAALTAGDILAMNIAYA